VPINRHENTALHVALTEAVRARLRGDHR
jgi:hypothetical protein